MNILSIYMSHDSSVCILRDGEVLLNIQLERFSRIKYDYGYREDFLRHCLSKTGLTIKDIDFLCLKCDLWKGLKMRPGTVMSPKPIPRMGPDQFVLQFDTVLLGKNFRALNVEHHLSHAASAFFTSPFNKAAIFTFDGGGDHSNGFVGFGQGNKIISRNSLKLGTVANVAAWWSYLCFSNYRMSKIHELDPGPAGKLMALAAYGKPNSKIMKDIEKAIKCKNPKNIYNNEDLSNTRSPRSQNVAASLQAFSEDYLYKGLQGLYERFPCPNVCYAGGYALNCIANSRVMPRVGFERLHVPPCPNDSGLALGMALYAYYHHLEHPRDPQSHFSPYTGIKYSLEDIKEALSHTDYTFKEITARGVADILASKKVVCFFVGRSECGPRALGHRSIIAHPGIEGLRDFLNNKVKLREWYRPFAPIVLDRYAGEVFEHHPGTSPYMSKSGVIRKVWTDRLNGILHVDNTTRPQIIEEKHDPYLYEIIEAFRKKTGIPVVLNTSFNCREPIVETPTEALKTFTRMPVDYMLMDNLLVCKKRERAG